MSAAHDLQADDARPTSGSAAAPALYGRYGFALDDFQLRAIGALAAGRHVLVAAPTGSGKTVVAEEAIHRALAEGRRAFYTAPIKALSNQKYHDLVRVHGAERVGLLTGDNSINGDAPVVVMTTEVLRNMIYARSAGLATLGYVVLDEVHFLQDTYRGPVWEEVIIHLSSTVRLVCLSATVSNADEMAEWMTTVRGPTTAVIEHHRPVRLEHLYMVGDKTSDRTHLFPTVVDGRPNPEASRLDAEAARVARAGARHRARRQLVTPRRIEVVDRLETERMLPAIYFLFSRNGCDDAAQSLVDAGVRLTTGPERDRIRELVAARLDGMDDRDLAVLGYGRFLAGLEAGIAAHHAGMVPPFKEAVEACFTEGLVKVVFATETLAVGINMPARSVVIEKLTKFTGDHHEFLTPSSYHQLTGRAGRRGIDDLGYAVCLWSPFVTFEQVAALAMSRSFQLTSAFRPTYNMAANLVRSYTADRARHLLNLSLAQYQTDRDVVKLEARIERRQAQLAEVRANAESPYGDIWSYRELTTRVERRRVTARADNAGIQAGLAKLRPGDVIMLERGRHAGRVAVLTTSSRRGVGVTVRAITPTRVLVPLAAADFDQVPKALARIELPQPFAPNRKDYQRDVAHRLERARLGPEDERERGSGGRGRGNGGVGGGAADELISHPVTDDPDLSERLRAATAADRIERELTELLGRVRGRSDSLARRFDRVVGVLEDRGYLDGWSLTLAGGRLARLFHECDLLVADALHGGLFDDLEPASVAALASVFVYEHRSSDAPPAPWFPSSLVRKRWFAIESMAKNLNLAEDAAGLPLTRMPDPTFVAIAYAWASGEGFADVVEPEELSGGDFVRTTKQLIDLVRQLAELAPNPGTSHCAAQAVDLLFRGVVAASTVVNEELPGAELVGEGAVRPGASSTGPARAPSRVAAAPDSR